jgi:hypothetical protein
MSNDIFKILSSIITTSNKHVNRDNLDIAANVLGILVVSGIHSIYAFSTSQTEEIEVVDKYKLVNYGSTNFMVVDKKGRHFNVNNSLWYWKWDSIEDWHNIKEHNRLSVKYYGWRSPVFGLFPNIVKTYIDTNKKCEHCS